ncbi:SapC family protein [Vreelandella stevensii]|uniref:SapC family protein n=1 Tax=Vreelandella stevensii TaxID=502821 RepID=UPI0037487120
MTALTPITEAFSGRRWQRFTDYRHALGVAVVPLTAPEASRAAVNFPLAFEATQQGCRLVAVLGLTAGVNLCVDDRFAWLGGYVPAYLRTPPFHLLPVRDQPGQFTLAINEESPWLVAEGGEPILAGKQLTPAVSDILEFLTKLQKHALKTTRAATALAEAGVLTPWVLPSDGGEPIKGLLQVDERALRALSDEQFIALRGTGAIGLAYAQMLSTQQLPIMQDRAKKGVGVTANTDALADLALVDDDKLSFDF